MCIGVVSDTPHPVRNVLRSVEPMNAAALDRLIHTGDVTRAGTLALCGGLASLEVEWLRS